MEHAYPVVYTEVSRLFCKGDIHVQHFKTRQKSRDQTLPRTFLDRGVTPVVKPVIPPLLTLRGLYSYRSMTELARLYLN